MIRLTSAKSRSDETLVRFASTIAALVFVVLFGACGGPTTSTVSEGEATTSAKDASTPTAVTNTSTTVSTTSTTVEGAPRARESTLGVSPEEFVDEWNTLFASPQPFLVIDSFDADDGTRLIRRWSDDLFLELVVDAESGELTEAALRGSFGDTSTNLTLVVMWFGLVNASNTEVNVSLDEAAESYDPIADQIGLPPLEGELPEGFGPFRDELYRSKGVVGDVLYIFEEVERNEYLLTATLVP